MTPEKGNKGKPDDSPSLLYGGCFSAAAKGEGTQAVTGVLAEEKIKSSGDPGWTAFARQSPGKESCIEPRRAAEGSLESRPVLYMCGGK